jgi:glyoxylase-like metal-dependent hydrolase (beta-lactamase superfamily II)
VSRTIEGAPVALFEDCIFATSGVVPASRPTSWIAPHLEGQVAVSCYVLVSMGSALIIDTGLAVHWDAIRNGLDTVLANTTDRALIMTRREPDAISNLPAIVQRYGLQAVYCGGVISPLDFFERVDALSASMHIRSIAATDVTWLQPGAVLPVGQLSLEVLPTTLRVLPKSHLYERRSRTLFTSDTWGLLPQAADGPLEIVRTADARLSIAAVTDYLRHRFEWLAGIDTTPMREELAQLLASRPIERICSSYGCVIEGRELVASVLQTTIQALDDLSRERGVSRLAQLDFARLAASLA